MISADEAIKIILESSAPCNTEELPLQKALGRYLSQSLTAPIDLPSFDHSAMDGYAVRCGDTEGSSSDHPISLGIAGTIAAGDTDQHRLSSASGSAFRIMTGAPIPSGADAVIPFEETVTLSPTLSHQGRGRNYDPLPLEGGGLGRGWQEKDKICQIPKPVRPDENIRKCGEDVRCGDVVLEKGQKITPRTMALLAAFGINRISVSQTPRVVVISTGNELVDSGIPLPRGKVYNSNGPALVAALAEIGINQTSLVSSSDDEKILLSVLKEAFLADVVITVGGVSTGDFDHVPKILTALGAKILFHKVAIKPGKPFLFATYHNSPQPPLNPSTSLRTGLRGREPRRGEGELPIFALPGNPVSALMVFDRFVRPALLKMMGASRLFRPRIIAEATDRLSGSAGKEDYLRVLADYEKGIPVVRSAGRQSSANLAGLARANAVAILSESQEAVLPGEKVEVEFLGEVL